MLGLMYVAGAALYAVLMLMTIRAGWRAGRRSGSIPKAVLLAALGFLAVYLPVFWNWLPVVIEHRRLCEADAGFSSQVDAITWSKQHEAEILALGHFDPNKATSSQRMSPTVWRSLFMGGLLATENSEVRMTRWGAPSFRNEVRVVDVASGQVLASAVDYSYGSHDDARRWLVRRSCFEPSKHPVGQLTQYKQQLKEAAK